MILFQVDNNILRITQAMLDDRGNYICMAQNSEGRARASAIVEVQR